MSQLYALLQTLSEQEHASLRSLRLIGKEKEVYSYLNKYKTNELPDSIITLKELKITDTHYYKINSILLRKCYHALIPNEGVELLHFLKLKSLYQLLRHEIVVQDKKLTKEKKSKGHESFYLSCFHYFIDFPYKYFDEKLTSLYGKKYLNAKSNLSDSDKLYVKYHQLFSKVNRMAARKNPMRALGLKITDLLKMEDELRKTKHYLATYYLYRSVCSYYTYYEKNPGKVIEYLKKAIALKDKIAYFFSVDVGQFLQLLYADVLFQNHEIKNAEKIYADVFKKGVTKTMYGYFYHCEQYVLISIIQKKYDRALALLNKVFQPCIDSKLDIYATRGAMSYVKFYLSKGELKNASNYLNIARAINEKTFYLPFDVQLRVLENIYFFIKKDYDFSFQLANRNIKFVRAQQQEEVFSDYLTFWKMILSFLNSIHKQTNISEKVKDDFIYLNTRYANLYCSLMQMMYDQVNEEIVD